MHVMLPVADVRPEVSNMQSLSVRLSVALSL